MTITAESVVVDLTARIDKFERELKRARSQFTTESDRIGRSSDHLRKRLEANSGAIGARLKLLAGTFAGAFSAQQIGGLIDGFTRLQNSLRVAGLEGENLADVQGKLLALSSQYGVSLEALSGLFGNAAQAGKELGASQSQILGLTEAVSQSLLITGTSSAQASGAILGLNQALAAGTVRAEEFNQINEGGLRPLLQAAANTDRFGGSVAKLRAAVLDGKVSSQEFFAAILGGAEALGGQASKATLTLAGAFESLNSSLTVYVGQAAQANGASAALSGGIKLLADNLDTVANALSIVAAAFLGRFVGGAVAGGRSLQVLSAYASIATTSLAGTALAARGAGAALLGAFGGPVGLAITAVVVGLGYALTRTTELERATQSLAKATETAANITKPFADAVDKLATAQGKAAAAGLAEAKALREQAIQAREAARAVALLAKAEALRLSAQAARFERITDSDNPDAAIGFPGSSPASGRARQARESFRQSADLFNAINANVRELDAKLAAGVPQVNAGGAKPKGKSATGKSAADIASDAATASAQFEEELRQLRAEQLRNELAITTDTEKRFLLQGELTEIERQSRVAAIEADKALSKERRKRLIDETNKVYGIGPDGSILPNQNPLGTLNDRDAVDRELRKSTDALRDQQATLATEAELAVTRRDRLAIERRILDLAEREEAAALDAAIKRGEVGDVQAARDNLAKRQANRRTTLDQQFESPLERLSRQLNDDGANIGDRVEAAVVDKLKSVNDGITEALSDFIGTDDPFIKQLLNILLEQVLLKPIAEALSGAGGGGGGIGGAVASIVGAVFGRASGGYVPPNSVRRVNEGRGGVELIRTGPTGTNVIPLGSADAVARQGGGGRILIEVQASEYFDGRVQQVSGPLARDISVEVVRVSGPQIARQGADIAKSEQAKSQRYG